MLRYVSSKIHSVAERLTRAVLLRLGLELNRRGTQEQLSRRFRKEKEQLREAKSQPREKKEPPKETKRQLRETKKQLREARRGLRQARRRVSESHWQPVNLRKPGLSPRTVVDVGVGDGTPALYEAFPEAFHVLIEPLKENEPHLQRILRKYKGESFLSAVGAKEEELTINVNHTRLRVSSIYSRNDQCGTDPVEKRTIPVTTLDALLDKHSFQPPFGLKIDTEGFDYQVIEGARNFLRETQFVIAEVNVAKMYEDGYSFAEFIRIMDENGFSLCDILRTGRGSKLVPPWELNFVDAMFIRADHTSAGTQEP